jgi:hypothetical protein
VIVVVVVAIWTLAIPFLMQWQLESALRRSVPAQSIKAGVRGRPDLILNGWIPGLTLDIRGARVDHLLIDAFTAQVSQVELKSPRLFRGGPFVVRKIGAGRATVTITEEGLRSYLEEAQGIRNARVRLSQGRLIIEGTIPVLQQEFQATMQGRLIVVGGREVVLHVESLTVSGVTLAPEIANVLVTPMNPLLRVDQLPIPLRLVELTVDRGRLMLTDEPTS